MNEPHNDRTAPYAPVLRLETYRTLGGGVAYTATVQCPLCSKRHTHGMGLGHRVQHCTTEPSANGYIITDPRGLVTKWEVETATREPYEVMAAAARAGALELTFVLNYLLVYLGPDEFAEEARKGVQQLEANGYPDEAALLAEEAEESC